MDPYPNQFAAGVCEVSVLTGDDVKVIGLFGNSITPMSYFGDPLTAILYERFPGKCAVINGGISGNRIQKSHPTPVGFPGEGHQFGIAGRGRNGAVLFTRLRSLHSVRSEIPGGTR